MIVNALKELRTLGQSLWLDYIRRDLIAHLAHDTQGAIEEARRLWAALGRPSVLIKAPAAADGLPAIQQLISEGIGVNVTLRFG